MRLTPAQIGIRLICGERLPQFAARLGPDASLVKLIQKGHDTLVQISGQDFGYDLVSWHKYLKESRDGGYTWARNIVLPKIMKVALDSPAWHEAVRELESRVPGLPKR